MSAIDTPDYQRGVVNAQKLLASVPSSDLTVTTGLPPNCETLLVALGPGSSGAIPTVTGTTSGIVYPSVRLLGGPLSTGTFVWAFDVSDVIDSEVKVAFLSPPLVGWYVYSDSGVHVTADIGSNHDGNGTLFTVPVVPYPETGYHPPAEVSQTAFNLSAVGNVLVAPGAGVRYRIFAGTMTSVVAGVWGVLFDSITVEWIMTCVGQGNASLVLPPQGLPLSANAALDYGLGGGAGEMVGVVVYTTESV